MAIAETGACEGAVDQSLLLSLVSTVICLFLAYPLGHDSEEERYGQKGLLVFLFVLPMWMNFLLRTMAWQTLLEKKGVINTILQSLGFSGAAPDQHAGCDRDGYGVRLPAVHGTADL